MGCASNDEIEEDLKHAAPDFEVAADPERTSYCKIDFRYRFVPGEIAQMFFKNQYLKEVVPVKESNAKKKKDSDDESSEESLKQRAYEPVKISYTEFQDDMMRQYSYLSKSDICSVYNYLNFRPGWVLKRVTEMQEVQIGIADYLRYAYVFYHYNEVLHQPVLAMFYYADEQFNRHASIRTMRNFLRQHFGVSQDEARDIIVSQNAKSSHITLEQFKTLMERFKKKDQVAAMFRVRDVTEFDVSLKSLNSEEREFSDISTRNRLNTKLEVLKRQAIEEGWDEDVLKKKLQDAEHEDDNQSLGAATFENGREAAVSGSQDNDKKGSKEKEDVPIDE